AGLDRSSGELVGPPIPGYVPLAGQLAEALLASGYDVAVNVGASPFKIDVALEGKSHGTPFRIAILCDEGEGDDGAYRRTQRASLLRSRGWQVAHVDSLEWLRNRSAVLDRIRRLVPDESARTRLEDIRESALATISTPA
ncbi:MAG: hypothetical protein RL684_448, partial [Pseudomonadota bacterium]